VIETQVEGVKKVTFNQMAGTTVQGVTNKGISDMGHVDSDLMGATSLQIEL
jgi:hypothetical protein